MEGKGMYTTQIQKWGNSQGVRIPKNILNELQLSIDEKVVIEVREEQIIIKKEDMPRKNIKELFAGYDGDYERTDVSWGKPVGKEIW